MKNGHLVQGTIETEWSWYNSESVAEQNEGEIRVVGLGWMVTCEFWRGL